MSIRPGWFWHENEEPHSLERLFQTYLTSVGANASFHLNLPPDRRGRIDERDVQRLKEFGQLLQNEFGSEIPVEVRRVDDGTQWAGEWELTFAPGERPVKYIVLEEDLRRGQRIESFKIADAASDAHFPLYYGTTVGNRAICRLGDPFALQNPLTDDADPAPHVLRVIVTGSRDVPDLKTIKAY